MTTMTEQAAITLTLADGTAREAELIIIGADCAAGILCPFCTYPSEGTACRNPACETWCDEAGLAARREAQREQAAAAERRAASIRFMDEQREQAREREQAAYNEAIAKAREEGYCEACVTRSLRHGGTRPRFTRHRDEANCPNAHR